MAEPGEKRVASDISGAEDSKTVDDVLPLANWMVSWKRRKDNHEESSNSDGENAEAFAKDEGLRRAREAEQKKHQLEMAIDSLNSEFFALVKATEDRSTQAQTIAANLESICDSTDDEIIKMAEEFEAARARAHAAVKACMGYSSTEHYKTLQASDDPAKQVASELLQRSKNAARTLLQAVSSVKARKREAEERIEQESKRQAAIKAAKEQERLFKRYDSDKDGVLSLSDVRRFISGEFNLDLSPDKLLAALELETLNKFSGLRCEQFPRLRLLVGVASVEGALDGVEVEVVKAEEQGRPLSAKGPVAFPIDALPDAVSDLDTVMDAARDYLLAAQDQIQSIPGCPASAPEAKVLSARLEDLQARLSKVEDISNACHSRIELQRLGPGGRAFRSRQLDQFKEMLQASTGVENG